MGSKNGRKGKIFKNGIYATLSSVLAVVLSFVNRKVFILTLGSDFLGYEGLFSNIFSILSVAEAGFLSLMYYSLYKEVALDNHEEISRLMEAHRIFYRVIGLIILVSGAILSIWLPFIITGGSLEMSFVYWIYFIQLAGTIIPYFMAYKRTLFIVRQEAFVLIKIDAICTLGMTIAKIIVLYITKNYILYVIISIIYNIVANLIISLKYNKRFSFIKREKLPAGYFKEKGLTKDIGNLLIGTIAGKVYSATDSIVITKILGISMAGLYANYYMISQGIDTILQKLTSGMSPAVGNYIHLEDETQKENLYKMMNIAYYLVALFVADGYLILYQPVVKTWLGGNYLLPITLVYAIALNAYLAWNHQFICILRGTVGHFEKDRLFYVLSAVSNLLFSIWLSYTYGITGIVIGTAIGQLFFWIGRASVVLKHVVIESIPEYVAKEVLKFLFALLQAYALVKLSGGLDTNFIGIVIRIAVLMGFTAAVCISICTFTESGRILRNYFMNILRNLSVGNK